MRSMETLRWASLVALGLWIGGLVALGAVAAPEIFRALEAQDLAGGRELAGRLFGTILDSFQYVAWGCGAVLLVSLGVRAALGPRPRRTALRCWTVALMLAGSAAVKFVISPGIDDIRTSTPGPISALAAADPVRVRFGRLHGASTGLLFLTVVAGLGLVWAEMKDRH
jgi:hypothetical protein